MAQNIEYLLKFIPDLKDFEKIREKMKAIDGGEFIQFTPNEAKKLKGLLQGVVDDVGDRAGDIGRKIQEGIEKHLDKAKLQEMLDIDTKSLRETMEIVEKLTGLIDDHSSGKNWLKDGKGFLGKLSTSQKELKGLEQSLGALEVKFEGLDARLTSTIAKFDELVGRAKELQSSGESVVVTPSFDFTKADKDVEEIKRKLNDLDGNIKTSINVKDVGKTIKDLEKVEKEIAEIRDQLDEPDLKQTEVKDLTISLANKLLAQRQYFQALSKLRKEHQDDVDSALRSNKYKMVGTFGKRANDVKLEIEDLIDDLSEMSSSGTGEAINLSIAVPTAEDIRAVINEEIKKLNKRKDAIQAVKLKIDDSIDSADNSTIEKTAETVSKSLKKIDEAIDAETKSWKEKIVNAFKVKKSEIDVPFTAEASAEIVFEQVQEFFNANEINIRLNKDVIVQQLKQAIEEGGLPAGGLGGGGVVNIDPETLAHAVATGLQGFFTGDFKPVAGEKKTVKEVQEKPKKAFFLDPQNEYNQEVAKTFGEILKYAIADGNPNRKVKGFLESKLVGSDFWDAESKSVNLEQLANGSLTGLVDALSYITEKYGETLIDDFSQLMKDTGKNKLLSNFKGDLSELLQTQNIRQITGDEHEKDLQRDKLWKDYVKKGLAAAGIGKFMGASKSSADELKLPETTEIDDLIEYIKGKTVSQSDVDEINRQFENQKKAVDDAKKNFNREDLNNVTQQIKDKQSQINIAKNKNDAKQVASLKKELETLKSQEQQLKQADQTLREASNSFEKIKREREQIIGNFNLYAPVLNQLETLKIARESITDVNDDTQKEQFLSTLKEFTTNVRDIYRVLTGELNQYSWGIDVKGFKNRKEINSASGVDNLWKAIGGDESRIIKPHLYKAPDSLSAGQGGLTESHPDRTDVLYRNTKVKDFSPRENTSKKWEESTAAKEAEKLAEAERKVSDERKREIDVLETSKKEIGAEIDQKEKELEKVQKNLGIVSFGGKTKELANARRRLTRKRNTLSPRIAEYDKEYKQREEKRKRAVAEQEHEDRAIENLIKSMGGAEDGWVVQSAKEKARQAANKTAEATRKSQEAKTLLDQAQGELDAIQNEEWVKAAVLLDTLKQKRKDFREVDEKIENIKTQKPKSVQNQLNNSTEKIDDLLRTANVAQEHLAATIDEAKKVEQWVDNTVGADGYKKTKYDIKHTKKNQELIDKTVTHRNRASYLSDVANDTLVNGAKIPENITEEMSNVIDSLIKNREIIQKLSSDFGFEQIVSEDELKNEAQRRLTDSANHQIELHPIIKEYYQKIINEGREMASQWLTQTLDATTTSIETQTNQLQSLAEADTTAAQALKPKLDEADVHLRETYQKKVTSWFSAIDKKMKVVQKGEAEGASEEAKRAGALAAKEIEDIYALINRAIHEYVNYFETPDYRRKLADLGLKYREIPLTEAEKSDPDKRKIAENRNKSIRNQYSQAKLQLGLEESNALKKELLGDKQSVIENRNQNLYSNYIAKITAASQAEADAARDKIKSSEKYNLLLARQSELLAEISAATLDGKNTDELKKSLENINNGLLKYQTYLTNVSEDIIKMEQKVALDRALGVPKEELDTQYANIDKARANAEKAYYEGLKKRQNDLLSQIKADTKEGKSTEALSFELKSVNEELLQLEVVQRRLEQLGASGDLYKADVYTVKTYNELIKQQIELEQKLALAKAQGGDTSQISKELRAKKRDVEDSVRRNQEARAKSDAANRPYVQALDYLKETQQSYEDALQKRYTIKGRKSRLERQLDDVKNDESYSTSWQYRKHQKAIKNRFVNEYVASDKYREDRDAGFETAKKKFGEYLESRFGEDKAKQIFYEFTKNQLGKKADKFDPNKFTGTYADMMRDGLAEGRTDAENEFKATQAYQDLVAQREAILKPYQDALSQAYDDIKNGRNVNDSELQQKIDAIDQVLAEDIAYLTKATTEDYPLLEQEVKRLLEGADPKNNREYEAIVEKARNNLIQQRQQEAITEKNAEAYRKLQPAVAIADKETQAMLQNAMDDYVREYFDKWIKNATDDVFATSGSEDVSKEFKKLLEENVYNIVSNYAESLVVKKGKLNGVDIRAEVEKQIQDQIDILNQHGVETEQDIANIETQRRAAMKFGGIKTGEIADAEVLREQAVLEGKLTLEKERQKELTEKIAALEKEGASSDELGKLGEALDKSNENIRKLEMFVANKDMLMEIQHQALKDEKVLEKFDLDQQKLYYEARKTAAEADLESGNEKVRKSAEERLVRLNGIIESLDAKIAERDQAERDARNPIKLFASAIKEALGGQGGGLNIDATGLATEQTLAQILAALTGGKVVGDARSEVAATIDKKSPEWKAFLSEVRETYKKNTEKETKTPKEIDAAIKALIEKIQDPKVDEKSKIALRVALKDALGDFASINKDNKNLKYQTNGRLSYEEMDKYFGLTEGTLKNLRLTNNQAKKLLGGQSISAQPKTVEVGDGGVNALARQETLSKIFDILNAFKSGGVKVVGKKQTEVKEKTPKVQKSEAELIKERALQDKDAVLGIAANSKIKNRYKGLVQKLESETDLKKIQTLAQKVSILGMNIKKQSGEWDVKAGNADEVYKVPGNFFGTKRDTVRASMEKLASEKYNPSGKKYEFVDFDGKKLSYNLIDQATGKVEKLTMEWSELHKEVAITSDRSTGKIDSLVGKLEEMQSRFKDAIQTEVDGEMTTGYLDAGNEKLQRFNEQIAKIDTKIADAEKMSNPEDRAKAFADIETMRKEALRLGAEVDKDIKKVEKMYTGTTEMNSATTQRNKLDETGILDSNITKNLPKVKEYNDAYKKLIDTHKQFSTEGTLYDENNQRILRNLAIHTKTLGKELEIAQQRSEDLKQKVLNSGAYNGKAIGNMSQVQEGIDIYTQMRAKLEELGATNIKVDRIHQRATGTIRHNNRLVSDLEVSYDDLQKSLARYHKQERESLTGVPAFLNGFQKKFNSIMQYLTMTMSVHRIFSELRRGVQYIKEIDLALTELRKVTSATDAEYDQFLKTAAKTGERLGATISAVTEATATFSKLGYEMNSAAEMAEAAIVYKNVGDNITSTEDAADSIISTLKGFKLESSETMRIVDRFNEVGRQDCPDYVVIYS